VWHHCNSGTGASLGSDTLSTMSTGKVVGTQALTTAHLEKIKRENPHATVYQTTYAKPVAVLPLTETVVIMRDVFSTFDAMCRAHPGESDESLRERTLNHVERTHTRARVFQACYAKVFAKSTVRAWDRVMDAELDKTRKFLMLSMGTKLTSKEGEEKQTAEVMLRAMQLSMRAARDSDTDNIQKVKMVGDGSAVTAGEQRVPRIDPLDTAALGPSLVHQGQPWCGCKLCARGSRGK